MPVLSTTTTGTPMSASPTNGVPPSPKVVKKIEKELKQDAKCEEKELKSVTKDMDRSKKAERKAHKTADKLERKVEKMTSREKATMEAMYKAEHKHEIAVADLNKAKKDLQTAVERREQLQEASETKLSRVEQAVKANQEHTQDRFSKMNSLRGSSISFDMAANSVARN